MRFSAKKNDLATSYFHLCDFSEITFFWKFHVFWTWFSSKWPRKSEKNFFFKNPLATGFLFQFYLYIGRKSGYLGQNTRNYSSFCISKSAFFTHFSIQIHSDMACSGQFRDIISRERRFLFEFRKKRLFTRFQELNIC